MNSQQPRMVPRHLTPPQHPTPPHADETQVQPPWMADALTRIRFRTLVRVELRKLVGTLSDRILLVIGPIALIGVTFLILRATGFDPTAFGQIETTTTTLRMAAVIVHVILIKLIAGEWQYRSVQSTLLVQPSRARYMLAQATVALFAWLFCAVVQICLTFLVVPGAVVNYDNVYLLGYRPGWVIVTCLLGAFLMVLAAFTVALLLPNAAGALAVYLVLALGLVLAGQLTPFVGWIDPSEPMLALAGTGRASGVTPVLVSLMLWIALLAAGVIRNWRRDAA